MNDYYIEKVREQRDEARAENKRLREALERLSKADDGLPDEGEFEHMGDVARFARAALHPEGEK